MKKLVYNPDKSIAMLFIDEKLYCGFAGKRAFREFSKACADKNTTVSITDGNMKITRDMVNSHSPVNIMLALLPAPIVVFDLTPKSGLNTKR